MKYYALLLFRRRHIFLETDELYKTLREAKIALKKMGDDYIIIQVWK